MRVPPETLQNVTFDVTDHGVSSLSAGRVMFVQKMVRPQVEIDRCSEAMGQVIVTHLSHEIHLEIRVSVRSVQ